MAAIALRLNTPFLHPDCDLPRSPHTPLALPRGGE